MDLLVRGQHVITNPAAGDAGILSEAAVLVTGSRIAAIGEWRTLRRRHRDARVLGNGKQLLMPGLVDAHSHGRALSPIQKGVLNDYLGRLRRGEANTSLGTLRALALGSRGRPSHRGAG